MARRRKISWRKILTLKHRGSDHEEIALEVGSTRNTVSTMLSKYRYLNGDGMEMLDKIDGLDISEGEKDVLAEIYKSIVDLKKSEDFDDKINQRKWEEV